MDSDEQEEIKEIFHTPIKDREIGINAGLDELANLSLTPG
jgi:hypothetical protein